MDAVLPHQAVYQSETDLATMALNALESTNGVKWQIVSTDRTRPEIDLEIRLEVGQSIYDYQVECKRNVDRKSTLTHIKHQLARHSKPGLLITNYNSAELAAFCKEIDLQFLDLAGNVYLQAPGLYIFVKGQKLDSNHIGTTTRRGISTVAAMKMIFALLCNQRLVNASYRDIAKEANIYLGAVGAVIDDLTSRGFIVETNKQEKRRLINRSKLIDEWVSNYPFLLRPKLKSRQFKSSISMWWDCADLGSSGAVWSGEVAAQKITDYLKPVTQLIYIAPAQMAAGLRELAMNHHFQSDPNGPIKIIEKFWNFPDAEPDQLAPTLLVYADLIASLDARNVEVAMMTVKVASLPALTVLKLFAWEDRGSTNAKVAQDLRFIWENYAEAGNQSRLFGQHFDLLESLSHDLTLAGIRLLAHDVSSLVSELTVERMMMMMMMQDEKRQDKLILNMPGPNKDRESYEKMGSMIGQFINGLQE